MEHLQYEFKEDGGRLVFRKDFTLAGVVASGNLEVMIEKKKLGGKCVFTINTAIKGFGGAWRAVITDFMARHKPANLQISINDNAASPAVVSLRLDQAIEDLAGEWN